MYIEEGACTCRDTGKWPGLTDTRQENVRCVMGYIVNLTVILDGISKTAAGNVTDNAVLKVKNSHIRSGCRDRIHRDIRNFVAAIEVPVPQKDLDHLDHLDHLVLEKIIDLIEHYCSSSDG